MIYYSMPHSFPCACALSSHTPQTHIVGVVCSLPVNRLTCWCPVCLNQSPLYLSWVPMIVMCWSQWRGVSQSTLTLCGCCNTCLNLFHKPVSVVADSLLCPLDDRFIVCQEQEFSLQLYSPISWGAVPSAR